ncbi:family 10 glycosyl hydrolase [Rhizodiscina lignyota]|uniref:Beta-xylanase n=1 Tax=Rhizodiscina lignyota TaxID=1504668 RepID=A0A9P4M3T3_9PEZI|nr:family 10 glycosyl hydrolase [Rhizodiscina lignyota]
MHVLLVVGTLAALVAAVPSKNPYASALAPPYLNLLAKAKGKLWFGTATDIPGVEQQDQEYMSILNDSKIFGQLTPANAMKFQFTEPEQNNFTYAGGQEVIDLAKQHGNRYVRCHNLVWVTEVSEWVLDRNWTAEALTEVMKNHIYNVVTHFGDSCYSWDVVNEALNDNGTWAPSVWFDTIGPEYFYKAYQFAEEAVKLTGKDIKLYYNDYNIEYPGPKATGVVGLVKELKRRKLKIDGVGLETHYEVGTAPSYEQQIEASKMYTALGVDIARTELDVRFTQLPYNSSGLALQAKEYYDAVKSCVDIRQCIGMTVWDFVDKYSWVPGTFPGKGGADIYGLGNSNYTRKPAYYAVGDALAGHPCSVCGHN